MSDNLGQRRGSRSALFSLRTWLGYMMLVALVVFLVGNCSRQPDDASNTNSKGPLKVGFITVGPISDGGYNYSHEESRRHVEEVFGDKVSTTLVEKVPESADVERVMERLIREGNTLLFPTSFGYLDPALRVAAKHPEATFMHCGGFKSGKNLGTYFAYLDEPYYLAGIVAGATTASGKLGFVAAHPIPNILREINAFTLGAKKKRTDAQVMVVWTGSWSDPAKEVEASNSLIDSGADVLAVHQDSPIAVVQAAEARGVYSVGCHADGSKFAPTKWLTGAEWSWGTIVEKVVRDVLDERWHSQMIRGGLREGFVKLSKFGPAVPDEVRSEVESIRNQIVAGNFSVFQGPISDRDGKVRIPQGEAASFEMLESMDWFVDGVSGSLPK